MTANAVLKKIIDSGGKTAINELNKAFSGYHSFHWGREPKEVIQFHNVIQVPDVVVVLGDLTAVIYRTRKGEEGMVHYIHSFSNPAPKLTCDTDMRQLFIMGGRYHIEDRGIVH